MEQKRIEELTSILRKLNTGNISEDLRKEALEVVKNIDPMELSIAEQNLIDEGMNPQDLRHLCDIHMEVLKDELEKIKNKLETGHVVNTLIVEHDKILEFLSMLEDLNNKVQALDEIKGNEEYINKLHFAIDNILDAEKHHQREEDVLFKELEGDGITGPTRIMRMEHDDLRGKKREIKELLNCINYMDFDDFKERLQDLTAYLVFNLRDHIFKENTILYPTAIDSINDDSRWDDMRRRCDEIGYCGFTPKDII
ncbi:histidine kinase [Clostridium baratii]|uniref:DUF438 domain-containing protein n=2 Tax=Clostridium TaxID=1485 RepID=A0ABN1LU19_9CLOT|nr:DUF438 domain-containing protein [Clostridium baratii]AQM60661.1 hypothetical protein NPD11_2010 [Clostridium baratii]MBS6042165.1 DUF438 domain-containing protein [Clostridium baratii]MBT9830368.1 DUF438 domain-containing protein [Clostridium baratii]MDY3207253.1 DUF438 domain-containing protein [Clostridium baratii]OPF50944.1 histidine kinase [Clostridium baratii]